MGFIEPRDYRTKDVPVVGDTVVIKGRNIMSGKVVEIINTLEGRLFVVDFTTHKFYYRIDEILKVQ